MKRALALSTLIFVASSLVGPLIRWATWPPSKLIEGRLLPIGDFIYDLVLLLWPAQPLAAIEVNTGSLMAAAVAIGANIFLFGTVGIVAGMLAKSRPGLVAIYVSVCALVSLLALWGAGFSFAYLNILALVVALLLYAIPFWATNHFAGKPTGSGQTKKES